MHTKQILEGLDEKLGSLGKKLDDLTKKTEELRAENDKNLQTIRDLSQETGAEELLLRLNGTLTAMRNCAHGITPENLYAMREKLKKLWEDFDKILSSCDIGAVYLAPETPAAALEGKEDMWHITYAEPTAAKQAGTVKSCTNMALKTPSGGIMHGDAIVYTGEAKPAYRREEKHEGNAVPLERPKQFVNVEDPSGGQTAKVVYTSPEDVTGEVFPFVAGREFEVVRDRKKPVTVRFDQTAGGKGNVTLTDGRVKPLFTGSKYLGEYYYLGKVKECAGLTVEGCDGYLFPENCDPAAQAMIKFFIDDGVLYLGVYIRVWNDDGACYAYNEAKSYRLARAEG